MKVKYDSPVLTTIGDMKTITFSIAGSSSDCAATGDGIHGGGTISDLIDTGDCFLIDVTDGCGCVDAI